MDDMSIADTFEGIGTVADTLSNNGGIVTIASIAIVMCIVLIFIMILAFVYLYKKFVDSKNNIEVNTNSIVTKMLEKVSDQIASSMPVKEESIAEKNHNKDLFKIYLNTNMIFTDASRTALDAIDANRIAIYVFHNGNSTPNGLPFFKMSCVHDVYKRKTGIHAKVTHTNMPLYIFNDIIDKLYKNEYYFVSDVDKEIKEKDDNGLETFVEGSETKSLFILGIRNRDELLCGFISAEFVIKKDLNDPIIFDQIRDAIEVMNGVVKYIITDDDFKQKYNIG